MSSDSFKNKVTINFQILRQEQDFASVNPQGLICHKMPTIIFYENLYETFFTRFWWTVNNQIV